MLKACWKREWQISVSYIRFFDCSAPMVIEAAAARIEAGISTSWEWCEGKMRGSGDYRSGAGRGVAEKCIIFSALYVLDTFW